MPKIKFSAHPDILDIIPHPKPASKFIPSWYKDLGKEYKCPMSDPIMQPTLKQCLPVRDMMTSGYIIPAWCDLSFKTDSKGKLHVGNKKLPEDFSSMYSMGFSSHDVKQVKGTPLENFCDGDKIMKLINPWMIKTQHGYSCLLISPFYETCNITILPAVVDTDNHTVNTNFPCVMTSDEVFVKKGDPLVQVIPFKRDRWTSTVEAIDAKIKVSNVISFLTEIKSEYTTKFWERKYYR